MGCTISVPSLCRWVTQTLCTYGRRTKDHREMPCSTIWRSLRCISHSSENLAERFLLAIYVAEPPELSRLKCTGHHPKGNTGSNTIQTEQFLVCRVTSRYNHQISDRTSTPRTKASPEILQPYIFYNTGIVVIKHVSMYLP